MSTGAHHPWMWRAAGWMTCAGYFFIAFVTDWFTGGDHQRALVAAGLLGVYLVYALLALLVRDERITPPSFRYIVSISAICFLVLVLAVPLAQTDFYHYFFEDVAWVYHGQNPYLVTPHDMSNLAVSQLSGWQELAGQHGPARLYVTLPAAYAGLGNPVWGPFFYRLIFALAGVASVLLVWDILKQLSTPLPVLGVLSFAWSPLLLYETQLSGGTDILMMFWLLVSVSLLSRRRWYWALAALTVSVLTKYATVLLLPFVLYYIAAKQPSLRRAMLSVLLGTALVAGVTIICFVPFWEGPEIFSSTILVARHFDFNSVPGTIGLFASLVAVVDFDLFFVIAQRLFFFSYAGVLVWFVARRKPTLRDLIMASTLIIFSLLLTKAWFYPKYLLWVFPLLVMLGPPQQMLVVFLSGTTILSSVDQGLLVLFLLPPMLLFVVYHWWRGCFKTQIT